MKESKSNRFSEALSDRTREMNGCRYFSRQSLCIATGASCNDRFWVLIDKHTDTDGKDIRTEVNQTSWQRISTFSLDWKIFDDKNEKKATKRCFSLCGLAEEIFSFDRATSRVKQIFNVCFSLRSFSVLERIQSHRYANDVEETTQVDVYGLTCTQWTTGGPIRSSNIIRSIFWRVETKYEC